MEKITKQLQYVFRKLLRTPLFSGVCILTLGLGIGANTAIFSVVSAVLLKPLPFEDPDRLVGVWHTAPGLGFDEVNQSPATYFTYRDLNQTFTDIGIWDRNQVSITGIESPEEVEVMQVTDGTLALLGVDAVLGRRFSREDDLPDSTMTVILSYSYWMDRFGGDSKVLGRTLTVDGQPREIIGVMPAGFRFLMYDPALLLPMRWDRSQVRMANFSYQALARLKDGVTIEQASADVERMIPLSVETFPGPLSLDMLKEAGFAPNLRPLKRDVVGDVGSILWVLLGTVGIVFLIACANVANLFLVRSETRHLELAIRSAMGADRRGVALEILSESVVLGVLGGLLGLLLAVGGIRLLISIGPAGLPRLNEIALGPMELLFTLGLSIAAGLLFGLIPVFKLARPNLFDSLKDGSRGSSEGRERQRVRSALVVAQVALALILLVGSGLMVRSFQALRSVDPGFSNPDQVMLFRLFIPNAEIAEPEQVLRTHDQIRNRLTQIPGVEGVGLTTSVAMDGHDSNEPIFIEDFPTPEGRIPPIQRVKQISPEYFEVMQNSLLAGRNFSWDEIWNGRRVVIITDNLACEYWDDPGAALGKRMRMLDESWFEIVGVVGNVHDDGVTQEPVMTTYWPLILTRGDEAAARIPRSLAYTVRSPRVGMISFEDELRSAVWGINPNLPLANLNPLSELLRRSMARTSFTLIMLTIAAAVALVLGIVGIYAVISYGVAQRTREIGVRMALGANDRDVSFLILRRGLLLTVLGLALGCGIAFALTRFMSALLYGVNPLDPITFAAVALFLGLIALLASYLPARRAAHIDPIDALRWD